MSSKDTKGLLKEAREAVRNKKFSDAIKLCSKILKEDNNHYMALLLMGACYQDTDKGQATAFLKRALACSHDPTVPLQGLANCVEKQELPAIYQQLLSLTPDKYLELHAKLLKIACDGEQIDSIVKIFANEAELKSCDERVQSAYKCLATIFKDEKFEQIYGKLVEQTLEYEIKNHDDPFLNQKFKRYLKLLFHMKMYEKLVEKASDMHNIFRNDITPLEWICHIYVERYLEKSKLSVLLPKPLETYFRMAVEMNHSSAFALAAMGIFHYNEGEIQKAIELLRNAESARPNWPSCLKVLAEIFFQQKSYGLAESIYRRLKLVNLNLFIALIEDGSVEKLKEALTYWTDKFHEEANPTVAFYSTKLQLLLENNYNIDEELERLNQQGVSDSQLIYLQALQYKKKNNILKAIELLKEHDDNFDCLLELSILYFETQNMEQSFMCALKATKLQPSSANCFHQLGKIYLHNSDMARARKCLEKCISLNPSHKEAIILLSTLYRNLSDWDSNSKLLNNSINLANGPGSTWAHLQLALHYLGQQQYDEAIAAFRSVIRYDVNNIASWEGLADAYMGRGSFNSAMRVFEKTAELSPDNLYPLLQLANIKNILKQNNEALELFGKLLKNNNDYFPAVKGIAESHVGLCYSYLDQRLIGKSHEHAQHAVCYFTRAIKMKSKFTCLWKQLGDVLDTVASFPKSKSKLLVEAALAGMSVVQQSLVMVEGTKLSELAGRCFCRAVQLRPDDSLLWYELAANFYRRGLRFSTDSEDCFNKLSSAIAAAKQAIKLEPNRWQNWNLLGVINATKQINNLALAQHCFIEAISLDKKTASVGWSNLGILYLLQGSTSLANKAFGRAQQIDTTYINAWIGQAIIAEQMGQVDEAIDLFRHCSQLGYHPESSLGYAHWVCSVMQDADYRKKKRYLFAIENLHALPVSHDAITWHCADKEDEASGEALRFLGYISYKLALWRTAAEAYQKALTKTNGINKDKTLCDLGYCLLKQEKYHDAVECFQQLGEATYEAAVGKALAYFKSGQYEESYSEYESTLNWLANSDLEKAYVLIAMSAMVYAFQGESDAKTILFQCITLPEPPIHAFFSACALGLLHKDNVLTELVIKELRKYEDDPRYGHHVVYLVSQFYWANMRKSFSLAYLISQVHKFPDRPKLRQILAISLLKNHRTPKKNLFLASNIAESALILDLHDKHRSTQSNDAAKWLAVASEAVRPVDAKRRRILAQKAVHVDPSCKEAWSSLIRILQSKP
ncbi:tetratricopeptide repeat protein 37 [Sabethes cyaneus]|uniref:tetratricopeptide repeat protein 37 n=1 Tax=Sabethes cyaneus TaxID=53552 RepID=UPI00237E5562|nr:tetratricopeptide repeat protein 37 [Sabethes cyaneus]XP_053691443.1 tetratricopeptide repeat protein 37 [Sabethes cyaneus]XP_053691444.1 tetratricopeptide repeat protein 37 [Sabethes cyaneus]